VGKGGRCVGLTILLPLYADCLEIWEPQPPGTLRLNQGKLFLAFLACFMFICSYQRFVGVCCILFQGSSRCYILFYFTFMSDNKSCNCMFKVEAKQGCFKCVTQVRSLFDLQRYWRLFVGACCVEDGRSLFQVSRYLPGEANEHYSNLTSSLLFLRLPVEEWRCE
jgi:hypothetical protein